MTPADHTTSIRLTAELRQALRAASERMGLAQSALIRLCLELGLGEMAEATDRVQDALAASRERAAIVDYLRQLSQDELEGDFIGDIVQGGRIRDARRGRK